MNNSELSKYILHYIREDCTRSAIMLTADWGTGKSYYIQNELIPFLGKEENGCCTCIVVSLYGLKSVEEISKSLYLESRMKFLAKNSEGIATGKFAVRTIVKGITSFLGVDLSKTEDELQELYRSVDLSGKLIIFEDIERSGISILEILGYVNSLVEQDGVRVLLVANEDEIVKYHISEPDKNGKTYKIPDEDTEIYLETKEKTVSDTISYCGDINRAISNLILSFGNELLNKFFSEDKTNDIVTMMKLRKNSNLRTFIFACQKISDIYNKLGTIDEETAQTIFFSVLSFSMQIKSGYFPNWEGTDSISTKLGFGNFPLYRFCYDYIRWQEFDTDKVREAFDAHKKLKLYNHEGASAHDNDLRVLFSYHLYSEKEVMTALENVESRLSNSEDIPIYSYNQLAYSLIACYTILKFDFTSCKEKMISNMQKHGKEIDLDILFLDRFGFENDPENQQFAFFLQSLRDAAEISTHKAFDFSYKPEDINSFYTYITRNEAQVTAGHTFISKFDLDKMVNMIFNCNPNQLHDWRGILFAVYRYATKADFLETDRLFMEKLISKINDTLSKNKAAIDRIVLLQINYLINNLKGFVDQLS